MPIDIIDDSHLTKDISSLFAYQSECRCMVDISEQIPGRIAEHETALQPNSPLQVMFNYENRVFSWEFGPYSEGEYHVISSRLGAFPLPSRGSQRVSLLDNMPFTARYTSPEGWKTYSPELMLVPNGGATEWVRE